MVDVFVLFDWVGGILIAGALALIAFTHKEIRTARLLLALGSILTVIRWLMWSFTTDAGWQFRALAGGVLGALLLAGLPALWAWTRDREQPARAEQAANEETSQAEAAKSLDNAVSIQCSQSSPPTRYREDKTLYIVKFQGVPIKGPEYDGQVAGPISFPRSSDPFKSNQTSDWYRCEVTNYGTKPLRNIRAKFPSQFLEIVKTDNGYKGGKAVAGGYALTPPFDLGVNSSDYFYFSSSSPTFIALTYPTTAQAQVLGDSNFYEIKLVPPSRDPDGFFLFPEIKDSPIAAHPSPAPPTPLRKR